MEPQTNNNEAEQPKETETAPGAETSNTEETNNAPAAESEQKTTDDKSEYRTFAILGYILPFLFFLPLLDDKTKNVQYVRFHANQQLILLIAWLALQIIQGVLYGMLMMYAWHAIEQLLQLALLVLAIIGIINGYKGEAKELPFIGQFKILK